MVYKGLDAPIPVLESSTFAWQHTGPLLDATALDD